MVATISNSFFHSGFLRALNGTIFMGNLMGSWDLTGVFMQLSWYVPGNLEECTEGEAQVMFVGVRHPISNILIS